MVQAAGQARQISHKFIAQSLATLDGEAVLVPLGGKRQCPAVQFLPQPQVRRVAGHTGLAGADHNLRLELAQAADDAGFGISRDEHGQPPAAGPGHDGRGQCRVPAAGDRQVAAVPGVEDTGLFHDRQMYEHTHEVPALVGA